jgi:hypothetical protein
MHELKSITVSTLQPRSGLESGNVPLLRGATGEKSFVYYVKPCYAFRFDIKD